MCRCERIFVAIVTGAARRVLAVLVTFLLLTPSANTAAFAATALATDGSPDAPAPRYFSMDSLQITGADPDEAAAIRIALENIAYPIDPAVFRVEIGPSDPDMPNAAGWYRYPESIIYVVRDAFEGKPRTVLDRILAHETGHLVEQLYFDNEGRRVYADLRNLPAGVAWNDQADPWHARPAEDFAEVFATLTSTTTSDRVRSSYGQVRNPESIEALLQDYAPTGNISLNSLRRNRTLMEFGVQLEWLGERATTPGALVFFELFGIIAMWRGAWRGFRTVRAELRREARLAAATVKVS